MLHTKYLSSRAYALGEDDFLNFSFRLPWQPEFCMEFISLGNFHKGPSQEHSYEVWRKLAQWFRRRCHLSKKLTDDTRHTTDDGHRVITIAHFELCSSELKRHKQNKNVIAQNHKEDEIIIIITYR